MTSGEGKATRLWIGMVAAVLCVFALAYLDSRNEQAHALDEFVERQAVIAHAVAATVSARFEVARHDPGHGPQRLLAEVRAALAAGSGPGQRAIIVDERGTFLELCTTGPSVACERPGAVASAATDVERLVAAIAQGGEGTVILGRPAAEALGLGARMAAAGYAPVPVGGDGRWGVAIVASARRVRDRARATTWRLGITTALASVLVAGFGAAIARQRRRGEALREALRLAEATAGLRERSEKMIEALPIGVLALDAEMRVASVNPYLAERGVRSGAALADALPDASVAEVDALRALLDDAKAARVPRERIGTTLRLALGERDVDLYAIPLARSRAEVDCFLVVHDRTQVRSLERVLVRAEKLATIGTLAAGVAHEVGTPLGIISGRAEQLLGRLPDTSDADAARKNVTSILAQVDKVSTTIRQLLDFARVRPIVPAAVSPGEALSGAGALLEAHFRRARVALAFEVSPSATAVAADAGQLEQVLVNLLMNACDACPPAGHVWARVRADAEHVIFEIVDDGAGIATEHLPMVLDPFFTTKKRGQGTGLGLTIAADIVKNHGGNIEIESSVGHGTTVRAVFPRASEGARA